MQDYSSVSVRSAASFREEARRALRGKWKPVLLVFFVILLLYGSIFEAGCTYSTSDELMPYWELEASVGPFSTLSYWLDGELYKDAAAEAASPFVLPYSPLFVAAAALTALLFFILLPIAALGEMRTRIGILYGKTPDLSVLRVTGRQYWLFARTELLAYWNAFRPMLLSILMGAGVAAMWADGRFILVLFALAGIAVMIYRLFSYAATIYLIVSCEDMTARKAVKTSAEMMKGQKGRLFLLSLSFIGWNMLHGLLAGLLEVVFGDTVLMPVASLIAALAELPLLVYLYTAQTAFLRDAYLRMNSRPSAADPADERSAETALPAADSTAEQPAQETTPDDPWADDKQP